MRQPHGNVRQLAQGAFYPLEGEDTWALLLPFTPELDLSRVGVRPEPAGLRVFHVPGRPLAGWLLSEVPLAVLTDIARTGRIWLAFQQEEGVTSDFYLCPCY